jgi:hypothetical protein
MDENALGEAWADYAVLAHASADRMSLPCVPHLPGFAGQSSATGGTSTGTAPFRLMSGCVSEMHASVYSRGHCPATIAGRAFAGGLRAPLMDFVTEVARH